MSAERNLIETPDYSPRFSDRKGISRAADWCQIQLRSAFEWGVITAEKNTGPHTSVCVTTFTIHIHLHGPDLDSCYVHYATGTQIEIGVATYYFHTKYQTIPLHRDPL